MLSPFTDREGHVLDWVIVRPDGEIRQSKEASDGLESDIVVL